MATITLELDDATLAKLDVALAEACEACGLAREGIEDYAKEGEEDETKAALQEKEEQEGALVWLRQRLIERGGRIEQADWTPT